MKSSDKKSGIILAGTIVLAVTLLLFFAGGGGREEIDWISLFFILVPEIIFFGSIVNLLRNREDKNVLRAGVAIILLMYLISAVTFSLYFRFMNRTSISHLMITEAVLFTAAVILCFFIKRAGRLAGHESKGC